MSTAFHKFGNSHNQQDQGPRAPPTRHPPPALVEILQEREHSNRDQHRRASHAAVAIVAAVYSFSPPYEQPEAEANQYDRPKSIHLKEPNIEIVQ